METKSQHGAFRLLQPPKTLSRKRWSEPTSVPALYHTHHQPIISCSVPTPQALAELHPHPQLPGTCARVSSIAFPGLLPLCFLPISPNPGLTESLSGHGVWCENVLQAMTTWAVPGLLGEVALEPGHCPLDPGPTPQGASSGSALGAGCLASCQWLPGELWEVQPCEPRMLQPWRAGLTSETGSADHCPRETETGRE